MELRHLRYFVAVAEEECLSRAAERVHIDPSPLSRAIRDLEAKLGVQLLVRGKGNAIPTWPGQVLLEDARRILSMVDQARTRVNAAASGYRGHLRIGVSDHLAHPLMSGVLAHCRREEPDTEIRIYHMAVKEMLRALDKDDIDIGFTVLPVTELNYLRDRLWSDRPVIAMPDRHPLVNSAAISIDQLVHYPLIAAHPESCKGGYAITCRWFREAGLQPNIVEYSHGHESMLMLVAAGYGVGLALASHLSHYNHKGVVIRPADKSAPDVTTYLIRKAQAPSPELSRFIARCRLAV